MRPLNFYSYIGAVLLEEGRKRRRPAAKRRPVGIRTAVIRPISRSTSSSAAAAGIGKCIAHRSVESGSP